jgi:amino acid transporter
MATVAEPLTSDEQTLAKLGYRQELRRGWSGFSNFAISFAIICILAGCFTTYGQAWNAGGPVAISIGWPIICLLILCVALSMAELASAFPTAGGIYYWASRMGGAGWGWFTGWFNLVGLVAVTASVVYISGTFLVSLLGLYNVNFIFNFASTNVKYLAHVYFAVFAIILVVAGLLNVFSSHLMSLFNRVSVWWNVLGVAVIVVLLVTVPSHLQSFSFVFGHRINNTGFHGGSTSGFPFWILVLPIGFLLTMYTITGYDASAHLSEETHSADQSAAKGVWRSVFYSAVVGYIVLLAITFAAIHPSAMTGQATAIPIFTSALTSAAAKAVILISTVGQLFCGIACLTSASRMTFAFSRDGAIPGHNLWRRLGKNKTPTWAVFFVVMFALIITIPAYFPDKAGYPVAFFAVTTLSAVGLYIAYTIPIFLRWRMGDKFVAGPWTLGKKYKWLNLIAIVWVALYTIIGDMPFSSAAVPWNNGFTWSAVNYAPIVLVVVIGSVSIWWFVSARKTFKGPIRTIDAPADQLEPPSPPSSGPGMATELA